MPQYGRVYVQEGRRIPLTNGKYITRERSGAEVAWLEKGNEGPMPIFTEDLDAIAIAKANTRLPPDRQIASRDLYPSRV